MVSLEQAQQGYGLSEMALQAAMVPEGQWLKGRQPPGLLPLPLLA
jgi:hypothetical protein